MLAKWRRRSAYERTNPERFSAADHAARVRATYAEEICAFERHPEVWFEWSQWELVHGGSAAAFSSVVTTTPGGGAAPASSSSAAAGGGGGGSGGSSSPAAMMAAAKAGEFRSGGNAIRAVAVLTLGMESLPDSALLGQAQAEILERFLGSSSSGKGKAAGTASDTGGGA